MEKSRVIELLEHLAWDKDNEGNCYGEALNMAIEALKAQLSQEGTTKGTTSDTISRQWLLECVDEGWIKFDTEKDANRFIHLVRDIAPTAQPVVTDTNVGDTISRQAAIDAIANCTNCGNEKTLREYVAKHSLDNGWTGGVLEAIDAIEDLPPAQPEPHEGHWIKHIDPFDGEQYECSECGVLWEFSDGTPEDNEAYFCPKCGAKMKGAQNG